MYEPSDDTWLLLDFLDERRRGRRSRLCLDLGSGTGIVGLFLLKKGFCKQVVFVDVTVSAVNNSMYNLVLNQLQHKSLVLFSEDSSLILRDGEFDLVVSNPPYLPGKPSDEYEQALLSGPHGYEAILLFIDIAEKTLRRGGELYIVYSSLSNPDVVESVLNRYFRIRSKRSRRYFYETLYVVEAVKK